MVCGDCGGENRKNARFCSWCGVRVALRCAVCATDVVPGAEFCDACGTPVGEPADTPAPLGARKVVTVLFADLAGSTSQAEQMDPESVRGFMDAYYAVAREAVEGESGRIVKLMGDGVMAAFGVPRVAEDDATRAVRAAASLQAAFAGLADHAQQQFGTPVSLRIGVNTGEVVVAVGDNDVVGDAVNVASRLEAAAGPGEIVVGESTWRLVRDAITLEALPPLSVKGKAEPVRAFRLVALEPPATATAAATSFVGRDAELGHLLDLYEDAVESGATRIVSVIGSPGVGKSRLSRELAAALESRAHVLEAGCPPAGGATFGPIADILQQAADVHATDDVERAASLLGAGAQASPEELFWAIRRALTSAATDRPLVVILDDVHWAEPMLLDLIEHLGEWGREAPILLVTVARPELRDLRPALAEGGRRVAGVVVLEGLGGEASQRLARDLLGAGDLPAAIAGKLLAVTQGNPLFLRELVRMLVDDGVLVRDGDAWITSVDAAELEVPPTVHALLSARIERLDGDERIILERAAVIGPLFPRGGVAAIAPSTVVDDLDRHLEALRRRELVEPEGTYWGDEPLYRFHHVLIRDAAYRGLLREARADLHERYADWLESKLGDTAVEHAEMLGLHLERAHQERQQLTGQAVPELGLRAAQWLALAGRRALERDDVGAAAGLLGRALDRAPDDDDERPSLLIDRAEAVLAAGDVSTGLACVTVLRSLAAGSERLESWAKCFSGQLANLTDPSRLHATVNEVSAAADRLAAIDDFAGAAKAHGVRAQALARLGRIAECEAALDKALAAARQAGDLRRANSVLAGAPLAALWGPSPVARASGKCLDVVRVLRITSGSPAVEATALRCQAVLEALRGRDDAARRMLAAARSSLEELGLRSGLLETDLFSGLIELLAGDPIASEEHLRRAHAGFRELGVDVDAAQAAALLARALLAQGRDTEAQELTVESERLGGEDLKTAIAWRSARAEALARAGNLDEALRLARQAVTLAQPTDLVIDHADALAALASVLRAAGRIEEAATEARRAADLYERKGATAAAERLSGTPALSVVQPTAAVTAAIPTNAAADASTRMSALISAMQWDELDGLLADDVVYEERRSGLRTGAVGKAEWLRDLRFVHSVPISLEYELLATRGDRLRLARLHWSGETPASGPFEGEHLDLAEVNPDGRVVGTIAFDAANVDEALAELDRRYLAGEGAAFADEIRTVQRWIALYNARDWTHYGEVWAPGFRVVDHRPAGWGELDGPGYVAVLQGMVDLAPDIRADVLTFDAAATPAVTMIRPHGTAVTGGPIEFDIVMTYRFSNGRLSQVDIYPPERSAEVGADVTGAEVAPPRIWNTALAIVEAIQAAAMENRWDDYADMTAEDATVEDRRAGLGTVVIGREAMTEESRFVTSNVELRFGSIATRGDYLALYRLSWSGTAEGDALAIVEINERLQVKARVRFDADDFDAAYDELDRRFVPTWPEFAAGRRFCRAINERDWAGLDDTMTDDFVFVDDFPAGAETLDRDGYVNYLRTTIELGPELRLRVRSLPAISEHGAVCQTAFEGPGLAGGATDTAAYTLVFIRDGKLARAEVFPLSELDVALRRFEEITRRAQHNPFADPHSFIARLADDVVTDDRRGGSRTRLHGRDATIDALRMWVEVGLPEVDIEVVATRGESLVLSRIRRYHSDDVGAIDSMVEYIGVAQADTEGRITSLVLLDADDLDAAYDELDDRFCVVAPGYAPLRALFRSFNERRWDDLADSLAPDCNFFDLPGGAGTLDRDSLVEYLRAAGDLAPEVRLRVLSVPLMTPTGGVVQGTMSGPGLAGGAIDAPNYAAFLTRAGKLVRLERVTTGPADEAVRRFRELTAPVTLIKNRAARVAEEQQRAVFARDWPTARSFLAADIIHADHRAGLRTESSGRANLEREIRVIFSAVHELHGEVLAVRGDRLMLGRYVGVGVDEFGNPFEVPFLQMVRLDDAGLIAETTNFDPEAIADAIDYLDERYLADEGREFTPMLQVGFEFIRRLNAQDWTGLAGMVSDGFTQIDHYPVSSGTTNKAQFIELQQRMAELAPDTRFDLAVLYRIEPPYAVGYYRRTGSRLGGGESDLSMILVTAFSAEKLEQAEPFPPDELDAAFRRFDELAAEWALGDEVIATRGSLFKLVRRTRDDTAQLVVTAFNSTGNVAAFLLDDIDAAYDELDRRYEALLDPGVVAAFRLATGVPRSFNSRESEQLADLTNVGFRLVDHTPNGFGEIDAEGWTRLGTTLAELAPDTVMRLAEVEMTPEATLSVVDLSGSGLGGGPTETTVVLVGVVRDGRYDRIDRYSIDQIGEANARFAELKAMSARVENAVTRLYMPLAGPNWLDRNWDDFVAIHAEDVVVEARTAAGERYRFEGRDECMQEARSLYELGLRHIAIEPLEIRGERLALIRFLNTGGHLEHGGGPSDVEQIAVCEANEAGQIRRVTIFEPGDMRVAMQELEAREAVLTPSPSAESLMAAVRHVGAEAFIDRLAEQIEFEDRRPGLRSAASGRDAVAAALRSAVDLGLREIEGEGVASRGDRLGLGRVVRRDPDSGTEVEHLVLLEHNDAGLITALINFATDDLDAAIAELDARYARRVDAPAPPLSNTASRLLDPFDWDAFMAAPTSENMVVDDRRKGLYATIIGRDEANAHAERHPARSAAVGTLAVRGDRLSLQRIVSQAEVPLGGGSAESEYLLLHEVDERGEVIAAVAFDLDDVDAAYRELDERYVAGEAAAFADVYDSIRASLAALNARDWKRWEARYAADFEYVDHSPVGFGRHHRREFIEIQRTYVALAPDTHWTVRAVHELTAAGVVAELRSASSGLAGGSTERLRECVILVDGGLASRLEAFAPGERAAAVRRFHELTTTTATDAADLLENAATRARQRGMEAFADDVLLDDRRQGFRFTGRGKESLHHGMRSLPLPITEVEPIAIRGERLALNHVVRSGGAPHGGGDAEVTFLVLHQLNDAGQIGAAVMFDVDDADAAFRELDDRFVSALPSALRSTFELAEGLVDAINRRAWSELDELIAPDFVQVDHERLGVGGGDRARWFELQRSLVELAPNTHVEIAQFHRLDPCAYLVHLRRTGSQLGGGATDTSVLLIGVVKDGRIARHERFALSQLGAALRRFAELCDEDAPSDRFSSVVQGGSDDQLPMTLVERTVMAGGEAMVRGDWDALAATLRSDVIIDDRRAGLRTVVTGAEKSVEIMRSFTELGFTELNGEIVAVRGQHLALSQLTLRGSSGADSGESEIAYSVLFEVDDTGQTTSLIVFDADDIDAAMAELDARFLAGEATELAVFECVLAQAKAANARDLVAFADLFTQDFEFVDRGPLRIGALTLDAFVEVQRRFVEATARIRTDIGAVIDLRPSGVLFMSRVVSEELAGEKIVTLNYVVAIVRAGRCARLETFGDDLHGARARLDELTVPREPVHNATPPVLRAARRLTDGTNNSDLKLLSAAFADDLVVVDHLLHATYDRDRFWANAARSARMPGFRGTFSIEGLLGERHAVVRWDISYPSGAMGGPWADVGGGETTHFAALRSDAGGSLLRLEHYPDLLSALTRAEELYGEDEATDDALTGSRRRLGLWQTIRAYNSDWDTMAAAIAPDAVLVDHRLAGAGPQVGRAAVIGWFQALAALIPDARVGITGVHVLTDDAAVLQMQGGGHDRDGGPIEAAFIAAVCLSDTGIASLDFFDPDDVDAARLEIERPLERRVVPSTTGERSLVAAALAPTIAAPQDWDVLANYYSPAVVVHDHDQHLTFGYDEQLANHRRVGRTPGFRVRLEPVLWLGRRHGVALLHASFDHGSARGTWREVGGVESTRCYAIGVDVDGRIVHEHSWEGAPLLDALIVAEEMYAANEATGDALVASGRRLAVWRSWRAYGRDWDVTAAAYAPGVTARDRRPVPMPPFSTRDELISWGRSSAEHLSEFRPSVTGVHLLTDNDMVFTFTGRAEQRDGGGPVEYPFVVWSRLGDGGVTHLELCAADDVDAAVAAASAPQAASPLARTSAALAAAINAGYPAAVDRCFAADLVIEDHINVRTFDRAAYVETTTRLMRMPGIRASIKTLIEFGARHGMCRYEYTSPAGAGRGPWADVGGTESSFLVVMRLDEEGRFLRSEHFREDDLLQALIRAEEMYQEGEASGDALIASQQRRAVWRNLQLDQDWTVIEASLAPDVAFVDHRPSGFPALNTRAELLALLQSLGAVTSERHVELTGVHLVNDHAIVVSVTRAGRDKEGGRFETAMVQTYMLGSAGVVALHLFAADGIEGALSVARARLGELTPATSQRPFEDVAQALTAVINTNAVEGLADLVADNAGAVDHILHATHDRAASLANIIRSARMPGFHAALSVTACLGSRHGVFRWDITYPGGAAAGPWANVGGGETTFMCTMRVNTANQVEQMEYFAADDLLGALIRAEELYLEDEATGEAATASRARLRGWQSLIAIGNGDWETVARAYAPDVERFDHRSTGLPVIRGREANVEAFQALRDLVSALTVRVTDVHHLDNRCVAASILNTGTDLNGASIELAYAIAARSGDDGISRIDIFPPDAVEDAIAACQSFIV